MAVEREDAGQLRHRRKAIDTGQERQATQVLTSQIGIARLAGQIIVRHRGICLRLCCNRIPGMNGAAGHNPRWKARDCDPWADPQITGDKGRTDIGHGRAAQNGKARCRAQGGGGGEQRSRPGVRHPGEQHGGEKQCGQHE